MYDIMYIAYCVQNMKYYTLSSVYDVINIKYCS